MSAYNPPIDLLQQPEAVSDLPYFHDHIEALLTPEMRPHLLSVLFYKSIPEIRIDLLSVRDFRAILPVIRPFFDFILDSICIVSSHSALNWGKKHPSTQIRFAISHGSLSLKTDLMENLAPFLPPMSSAHLTYLRLEGNPGLIFLKHASIDVSHVNLMELSSIDRFPDLSEFSALETLVVEDSTFPTLPLHFAELPRLREIDFNGCDGFEFTQEFVDRMHAAPVHKVFDLINSPDIPRPPLPSSTPSNLSRPSCDSPFYHFSGEFEEDIDEYCEPLANI